MISGSRAIFVTLVSAFTVQAQLAAFRENWAGPGSPIFDLVSHGGSTAVSNVADAHAEDGRALQLMVAKDAATSPAGGSQIESKSYFLYGTMTARLKTVDCSGQPDAGVVTGYFSYFNDGSDKNGDGLPDNSELDFEWLCAEPQVIFITLWTDYRGSDDHSRRVSRALNLATGVIYSTQYQVDWSPGTNLTGVENQPATLTPLAGYNSSAAYYEYGVSWSRDRMLLWIVDPKDQTKIPLWDYRGPAARIPPRASRFMINAWHTGGWTPPGFPNAVKPPASALSAFVDWAAYDPAPVPTRFTRPVAFSGIGNGNREAGLPRYDARGRRVPEKPIFPFIPLITETQARE